MSDSHRQAQEVLQDCIDLLDNAAKTVKKHQIEPCISLLENIGMAIGEILHAKKKIADDADE